MEGNLAYVQSAMQRFDSDKMAMIGMTSPNDVLNPEVMKDGNSGYKLQLAMGPNQLIQDEMVKNCAIAVRDMIYLVWKTLLQYSDDYNIQQLAGVVSQGKPFMDAISMENFEFIDRKLINIDLALGFLSEENRLTRQQLIVQCQTQFAQAMMQIDPSVPELFAKVRRPYEDTLRVLNVKDVDAYLPTLEEATKIMQAKSKQGPSMDDQEKQSKMELNKANSAEKMANVDLIKMKTQEIPVSLGFESQAAKEHKLNAVEVN
jgi:hypothetical protein